MLSMLHLTSSDQYHLHVFLAQLILEKEAWFLSRIKNPELLLCDEPTGALDLKTGIQILKLLRNFNIKYRKTVMVITHNASIADMADRVFILKDGELVSIRVVDNPKAPEEVSW